jgi:hypothetical protein
MGKGKGKKYASFSVPVHQRQESDHVRCASWTPPDEMVPGERENEQAACLSKGGCPHWHQLKKAFDPSKLQVKLFRLQLAKIACMTVSVVTVSFTVICIVSPATANACEIIRAIEQLLWHD